MPKVVPIQPPRLMSPVPDTAARGARVHDTDELGAVVRWARHQRRLSRTALAAQVGVSEKLLRDLEGAKRGVRLDTVLLVLTHLNLDLVIVPRDPSRSLRVSAGGGL